MSPGSDGMRRHGTYCNVRLEAASEDMPCPCTIGPAFPQASFIISTTSGFHEADLAVRAYVAHFGVGEPVVEMPLFLEPDGCVDVPLEATYARAFDAVPTRWRDVLQRPG
jgi:hypothetical protein